VDIKRFRAGLAPTLKDVEARWQKTMASLRGTAESHPAFVAELRSICDPAGTAEKSAFGVIAQRYKMDADVIKVSCDMLEVEHGPRMDCRQFLPVSAERPEESSRSKEPSPPPKAIGGSPFMRSLREAARKLRAQDPPSKSFPVQQYTRATFAERVKVIRGRALDETEWDEMKDLYAWRNKKSFEIKKFCEDLDRAEQTQKSQHAYQTVFRMSAV
jgi:hypothetical protein